MDALGGRDFLRLPCRGRIPHWLAGMGPPDSGDRHANHEILSREYDACGCRVAARPSGMATARTQPGYSVGNAGQCGHLSYTPYDRTRAGGAGYLYGRAPLCTLLFMGLVRRRARRCAAKGDREWVPRRDFDDAGCRPGCEMAQQRRLWRVAMESRACRFV